ncbi:MAG: hypothetical protein ACOZAL_02690 [Patescibacteria group bacterium]
MKTWGIILLTLLVGFFVFSIGMRNNTIHSLGDKAMALIFPKTEIKTPIPPIYIKVIGEKTCDVSLTIAGKEVKRWENISGEFNYTPTFSYNQTDVKVNFWTVQDNTEKTCGVRIDGTDWIIYKGILQFNRPLVIDFKEVEKI